MKGRKSRTARQLSAAQQRSLRTMQQRLLRMADEWEDVDGFNVTTLTELADHCLKAASDIKQEPR